MKIETRKQFATRYHAALKTHLQTDSAVGQSGRLARSMGRDALSHGLNIIELTRMHDRSLHALVSSQPLEFSRNGGGPSTPAGAFLIGVLTPIERTHQATHTTEKKISGLQKRVTERRIKLRAVKKQLQTETALRRASERHLIKQSRRSDQLVTKSREMERQLRNLAHQVLSAQEEERKEISRELHDEVAQILAGINVRLSALSASAGKSSRSLQNSITQTQRLVEKSVDVVHRYARELRPAMLDNLGLIPTLRSYIRDLTGRKKLQVVFQASPEVEKLNNTTRTALYRVCQEALTNVIRHARATNVDVTIRKINQSVRLEIHDDGRSFALDRLLASKARNRLGIIGMRERIEMVGGAFSIQSEPGKGTTVRATVPLVAGKSGAKI